MNRLTPQEEHESFLNFLEPLEIQKLLVVDLATGTYLKEASYGYSSGEFRKEGLPSLRTNYEAGSTNLPLPRPANLSMPYGFELPLNHNMDSRVWWGFVKSFSDYAEVVRGRRIVTLPVNLSFDERMTGSAKADWNSAIYHILNGVRSDPPPMPASIQDVSYARETVTGQSFLVAMPRGSINQISTAYRSGRYFTASQYTPTKDGVSFSLFDPTNLTEENPKISIKYGIATRKQKRVDLPDFNFEVNPHDPVQSKEALLRFDSNLDDQKVFSLPYKSSYCLNEMVKLIYTLPLLMQNPASKDALLSITPGDIISIRGPGPLEGTHFVETIYRHGKGFPFLYLRACV